jgi:hypothetical protein
MSWGTLVDQSCHGVPTGFNEESDPWGQPPPASRTCPSAPRPPRQLASRRSAWLSLRTRRSLGKPRGPKAALEARPGGLCISAPGLTGHGSTAWPLDDESDLNRALRLWRGIPRAERRKFLEAHAKGAPWPTSKSRFPGLGRHRSGPEPAGNDRRSTRPVPQTSSGASGHEHRPRQWCRGSRDGPAPVSGPHSSTGGSLARVASRPLPARGLSCPTADPQPAPTGGEHPCPTIAYSGAPYSCCWVRPGRCDLVGLGHRLRRASALTAGPETRLKPGHMTEPSRLAMAPAPVRPSRSRGRQPPWPAWTDRRGPRTWVADGPRGRKDGKNQGALGVDHCGSTGWPRWLRRTWHGHSRRAVAAARSLTSCTGAWSATLTPQRRGEHPKAL